jgi:molybdate transport repressor ModE-like protein
MDMYWDDARLFLAVAELGSVSAAARALRLAQPTVSRRVREMEESLGFTLFERTHGGTALTARGEQLLEPARRMAEWAAEFARAVEQKQARPGGLVRVTAPPGIAFEFLAPFAGWLRKARPELRLEVLSTVEYLDLSRGAADLAIRMRAPARELTVIASAELAIGAYASQAYAARLPREPALADIDWVGWAPPFESVQPSAQLAARIPGFQPSFTADDFLVQLAAAEAGAGAIVLGSLPHRFARRSLVELDLDLSGAPRPTIYLVAAKRALDIRRIRAVADLLAAELGAR